MNDDNDIDSGSSGIVDFRRRCSDTTEETPSVAGVLLIVKGRERAGVTKDDSKELNDDLFLVFFSAVFSDEDSGIVDFRRRCSDTTEETPSVA